MSNFFAELWLSVFEPGTNKSLVTATHVSFALLQIVFLLLLVATKSGHFVLLSLICAGLWIAITWFIGEIDAIKNAEALEKEAKKDGGVEVKKDK